jgi:hypothetical protein
VAAVHTPAIGGLLLSFSACSAISLGYRTGSLKLGKHLAQKCLPAWASCPADVKSCARERAICHMQFLPVLERPRPQDASETAEAFAL